MKNIVWKLVAKVVSQPRVAQWLYAHSTPYFDLYDRDTKKLYMHRVWVFNGILDRRDATCSNRTTPYPRLPSVRIHRIMRPDLARDPHDHPWNARTIILKGWYRERRDDGVHYRHR